METRLQPQLETSLFASSSRILAEYGRSRRTRAVAALASITLLIMSGAAAGSQSGAAASGQQPAPAKAPAETPAAAVPENEPKKPAEYVGTAVCMGCHEEIYNNFIKRNPHRLLETDKKRKWDEKACESCHGPGSNHAESASPEDIQNPGKLRANVGDRLCLKCHLNTPTQVGRVMGGHARGQVRCADCHSMHSPEPKTSVWAGKAILPGSITTNPSPRMMQRTALCATCHTGVWAEFQRPHRHKLPEGAMNCTDCHNPHGGTNRTQIMNVGLNEPGCFRCHTDKQGPFTFEHAPVRTDGCPACHQPHGSANPRMLTRPQVRYQCLECHTNFSASSGVQSPPSGGLGNFPPSFHDLRSPRFQNCTNCHLKIHGSHVSRDFLR